MFLYSPNQRSVISLIKWYHSLHSSLTMFSSLQNVLASLMRKIMKFFTVLDNPSIILYYTINIIYNWAFYLHTAKGAERHQLTPSVYAGIIIKEKLHGQKRSCDLFRPNVHCYSGKHSSSTATTYAKDLVKLLTLDDFESLALGEDKKVKPVIRLSVDGGPDENPRYKKVIISLCITFQRV